MACAYIDMDDPPPFLARHKELLDHTREVIRERLSTPSGKHYSLGDIVVAATRKHGPRPGPMYSVKITTLAETLRKVPDARMREQLKERPMPGCVRMIVSVWPSSLVLTARVRDEGTCPGSTSA